jgi:hypothetical protein
MGGANNNLPHKINFTPTSSTLHVRRSAQQHHSLADKSVLHYS